MELLTTPQTFGDQLHCHRNGADSEYGIEACHAFAFQGVEAIAFSFLVKMLQSVLDGMKCSTNIA